MAIPSSPNRNNDTAVPMGVSQPVDLMAQPGTPVADDASEPEPEPSRTAPPSIAINRSTNPTTSDLQRNYLMRSLFTGLVSTWRALIEQTSMILGSKQAIHTIYAPSMAEISKRVDEATDPFNPTLENLADSVEKVMLQSWSDKCHRVIQQ
ncbi:hypothetical protein F5Y15DRAFT_128205 [Xylariaceae sp. FL0016]|nr:hypothetical protein F5Y15DRAFT_128205 [Xylariaceae sp. FL0016]